MKVKITYKQDSFGGIYMLKRVIDFTPERVIFKDKVEQEVLSNGKITNEEYVKGVREVLNYTNKELIEVIQPVLDDYGYDPASISYDVSQYKKELDIDIKDGGVANDE